MNVLAVGLGVTGLAVARHAAEKGWSAVVVEDDPGRAGHAERRDEAEARGATVVEAPGEGELEALVAAADLVVPSPGVPVHHPVYRLAASTSTSLVSEIELASRSSDVPIVAVTGTNGKTTVTTLITEMLRASGVAASAAGNIGRPLLEAVTEAIDPGAVLVAEVSSFQLQYTEAFRPAVAVILNIADDHFDWHPSLEHYRAAKARVFANQTADDVLVVNADDPVVEEVARGAAASVVRFSLADAAGAYRLDGESLVTPDGEEILNVGDLDRSHPHDLANALAATAAARAAGATLSGVADALRAHRGLPHRLTLVGDAGGVRWFDDSKATNPHATLSAVEGFDSVVLVAGGRNKGLDLGVLAEVAPRLRAAVLFGEAAGELEGVFAGSVPTERVVTMREAVEAAGRIAERGDVVLLSPGCASFDAYPDYAARGDDFAAEVRRPATPGASVADGSNRRSSSARATPGSVGMLVATILALNVVGLVMVMSASSVVSQERYGSSWVYVQRQLMWTGFGLAAFVVASRFDYRRLRRFAVPAMLVVAGLLVIVFVPGVGVRAFGSSRWIGVGAFTFQPAELAKLALAVFAADLVVRRADVIDDWRRVLRPVLLVFLGFAVLVMRQPDMGTTVVLTLVVGSVLFAGGIQGRHLAPMAGAGLLAAVVLAFAAPYRRARVLAFLDPFSDAGNTGYQAVQSLIALGSGGLFGVGLGAGRQKWLFLPNAHTDFIFAVIGEELGLLGAFLVVLLFAAFGVLGFRAAMKARDRFGYLLAVAVTTWIVGQAVINIGAAVGLLPITGVPLPFVSFGGSALFFTMAAAGVLVNVARQGGAPTTRATGARATAGRGR